jgi:hypothetical protein
VRADPASRKAVLADPAVPAAVRRVQLLATQAADRAGTLDFTSAWDLVCIIAWDMDGAEGRG